MRYRFDTVFRAIVVFLLATLAWGIWANAQTNTNQSPVLATNQPSTLIRNVERLEEHHLTFGLDRLEPLREHTLLGEPLWKYAASLIYILLAFYAARLVDFLARVWLKRLAARTETLRGDLDRKSTRLN